MFADLRTVLALGIGLILAGQASAQETQAQLTSRYIGQNLPPVVDKDQGKNEFRFTYKQHDKWLKKVGRNAVGDIDRTESLGLNDWVVPDEQFGTAGMDRQYKTFAAEYSVPIQRGFTYKYEIMLPTMTEAYGLGDDESGKTESIRRSQYVRELFGRHYIESLQEAHAAKAFQIALFEIIHESGWVEGKAAPLDLDSGEFTVKADDQSDMKCIDLARTFLKELTGNDNLFYENPELVGRELVWLKGHVSHQPAAPISTSEASTVELAGEVVVAPSQFALQYVRGGGAARNVSDPTSTPGGGSGAGGGAGGGGGGSGSGYGGGNGGGAYVGGGGGGFGASPVPPSTTTTPPTSTVPPINQPPTNPPETPTNPVPAPAGIVLGIIALGLVAGRRVIARR